MTGADPFDLDRFVQAQAPVIDQVRRELAAGAKRSHWMWFVFPQLAGLGSSPMARRYAIGSLAEARAFMADPVLSQRLAELAGILLAHAGRAPQSIFGEVDAMKLRSCLTLFEAADGGSVFGELLDGFFGGVRDPATLARLAGNEG
ncbi:MAG TPA: DUF1810 domain-containing protein [Caulobacteraceae bacterium]|jgi:uncharacterized protein (DUF1810 family)|nr:DUF1810 domain-containing protein [Caulobacteraceae bacterium]